MRQAIEMSGVRPRRRALLAALTLLAAGIWAVPAHAGAVKWTIAVGNLNAYGQQRELCPTKVAEPTAPTPCGVDPFTETLAGEKGETFARASGSNAYVIRVTNSGEATSSGQVKVVDTLPNGMLLTASNEQADFHAPGWKCGVRAGATVAECVTKQALEAGKSFEPITLYVAVKLAVKNALNPSEDEEEAEVKKDKAAVTGGGGAEASVEQATTVTEAVPFGVHAFNVHVLKEQELKSPFTEELSEAFEVAGGRPFAVRTEVLFNYSPKAPAPLPGPVGARGLWDCS